MRTKHGTNKETNILKAIMAKFIVTAFADEGNGEPTPQPINYENLIANARKEEKDKLYPKIQKLEEEIKSHVEKSNGYLIRIGELETENSKLKSDVTKAMEGKVDNSEVERLQLELNSIKEELTKAQEELKATIPEEEIRNRIKAELDSEYQIKAHLDKVLAENKGSIIPDLISGTTIEEIDNSLAKSKERFTEIFGTIVPPTAPTLKGVPPMNIATSKVHMGSYSIEDLAKLDPRSAEYKEMRKQLGLK